MLQFITLKQLLKRVSLFTFFFLFIATFFYSCKKVENNNSILNYESGFTKHFFETKTTPTVAIAAAIEKLKQENERTGFVNKLPKNCGLPLWEKLLFQKPAGNKSINNNTFSTGAGNNLTETEQGNSDIVIPLTINNSNLSSILIATSINDTFAIKCLTTNDYLYNVSHGSNVDTAAAMNNLTAFFYVENYSFGTTQFYHIPANLFSRSTVLNGDGNKTITIKNVDSSTNNLMVCVCVTVVCPVCLGNDPNCPLGGTWQECSCTTVHDDEPGCPWCLPPPPPDGGGGSGGGGTGGGGGTSCSFASSWYNSIIPDCGDGSIDYNCLPGGICYEENGNAGPGVSQHTRTHVLKGEIKNGRGKGCHSLNAITAGLARWKANTNSPVTLAGGIKGGYIDIKDPVTGQFMPKTAFTTFFPQGWSDQKIIDEITYAFGNKLYYPNNGNPYWEGLATNGLKIRMFLNPNAANGEIITAFPIAN